MQGTLQPRSPMALRTNDAIASHPRRNMSQITNLLVCPSSGQDKQAAAENRRGGWTIRIPSAALSYPTAHHKPLRLGHKNLAIGALNKGLLRTIDCKTELPLSRICLLAATFLFNHPPCVSSHSIACATAFPKRIYVGFCWPRAMFLLAIPCFSVPCYP